MIKYEIIDFAVCEICVVIDGVTTAFDLLGDDGIYLVEWTPKRPLLKGGGTFQNSPIADGQRLVFGKLGNVTESIKLSYENDSPEGAIFDDRRLQSMLNLSVVQGTGNWKNVLVYWRLKTKGTDAVDQYAYIEKGELVDGTNPFMSPFQTERGKSVWEGVTLNLEHRIWGTTIPGSGDVIELGVHETYNGQDFGTVDNAGDLAPTTSPVYAANYHGNNNITNVHLGTAGANLIGSTGTYNILSNANPLYIGMSSAVSGFGIFHNVWFNLSTAATGTYTLAYEYWNGSTWAALSFVSGSTDFAETGNVFVGWTTAGNTGWTTNTPGGALPTGYWIRIRVASGSLSTIPQQTGRVQSVTWPYVQVESDQVAGDIEALAKMIIRGITQHVSSLGGTDLAIGLRSTSRGDDFTAVLNCYDGHNNSDITFSETGTNMSESTSLFSPSGGIALWSPASAGETATIDFTIDAPLAAQYAGRFKMYLRFYGTSTISDGDFRAQSEISLRVGSNVTGRWVWTTGGTPAKRFLDLGEVVIPGDPEGYGLDRVTVSVNLVAESGIVGKGAGFTEIWLLPIDECAVLITDVHFSPNPSFATTPLKTHINSIQTRRDLIPETRRLTNDILFNYGRKKAVTPLIAQKGSQQRYWIIQNLEAWQLRTDVIGVQMEVREQYTMFVGKGATV